MNPTGSPSMPMHAAAQWVWLQRLCGVGTGLALCILGTSILLRLTTVLDAQGNAVSTLAADVEHTVRMLHRVCASSVALLALGVLALCWRARRTGVKLMPPAIWIVVSTVVLALIGPLTSGYRLGSITVVNVSFGMALLMAFWWLRESIDTAVDTCPHQAPGALSWAVFIAMVLHIGTGAGASAWALHGVHGPAYVHLATLLLGLMLVGILLFGPRNATVLSHRVSSLAALLGLQIVVGGLVMWQDPRSTALSYLHAMLSPLVAAAAVSIMVRGGRLGHR